MSFFLIYWSILRPFPTYMKVPTCVPLVPCMVSLRISAHYVVF